jgi:hypothetical protein
MAGYFVAFFTRLATFITKPSTRVRVGLVALVALAVLAVSVAIAAPDHMAVLAGGQAWGK